jgi:ribulose-5-phosphate 4-epimerase/fuculose-1-phosphate aldolase
MELLAEYVSLCRMIGGWTDWVQGVGGNISIKCDQSMIVKRSGARIADTTMSSGWVLCSIPLLRECMDNNTENTETAVLGGSGKPSIEAFMHMIPHRIVVHLHPAHLLNDLCRDISGESAVPVIPYVKPGLELAHSLMRVYTPSQKLYFLQNHGIVVCGDTVADIICGLQRYEGWTNLSLSVQIYNAIGSQPIIKTIKHVCDYDRFRAFTPDILVFLQQAPLHTAVESCSSDIIAYKTKYGTFPTIVSYDNIIYIISPSIAQCYDILEIFMAYADIDTHSREISADDQYSITHWDKELARKEGTK